MEEGDLLEFKTYDDPALFNLLPDPYDDEDGFRPLTSIRICLMRTGKVQKGSKSQKTLVVRLQEVILIMVPVNVVPK